MSKRPNIPPIVNCRTIPQRDTRTLVHLREQPLDTKWGSWSGVVTSVADFVTWNKKCNITALILLGLSKEDMAILSTYKGTRTTLFVNVMVFQQYSEAEWRSLQTNIVVLESIHSQFPIIGEPWANSEADAIACITMLFHHNHIIMNSTLTETRLAQLKTLGIRISPDSTLPPQIWLITQYFVHKVTKRAKEIRQCLKNNMACSAIDKIILLNESDLAYEWSGGRGSEKVQQEIIKTRLTYMDLLKYTYEKVPPNTIVVFANADIYCNRTLELVTSVNMEDKLFALLRYDEGESANDIKLFGPRPDSQDTWIMLSDSVKSRTWDWPAFNYKLGIAGCDNRFTGDMFGMRFLVFNPCQSIQTIHLHKTEIRDYVKSDILPAKLYMYIHPCPLLDVGQPKEGDGKAGSLSPRLASVEVKTLVPKKALTYCTMLARENRFKWSSEAVNSWSAKPLTLYKWTDSFVLHSGIVYNYKNIYVGADSDGFMQKLGRGLDVSFIKPCEKVNSVVSIPCTNAFANMDLYCLHYLSYVIQIFQQLESVAGMYVNEAFMPVLQTFVLKKGYSGPIPAITWNPQGASYAKEVVGFLPETAELSTNEIRALREAWPEYREARSKTCVALIDDILTPEFIDGQFKGLLPEGWSLTCISRKASGLDVLRQITGAGLCILYNLPKVDAEWAKLWALPKGCPVVEFQNELKVEGGFQHFAAAAELNCWLAPLHKGPVSDSQKQILDQFKLLQEKLALE
jgi:hypothetical protein